MDDNRSRQNAELQLLESMYPTEYTWQHNPFLPSSPSSISSLSTFSITNTDPSFSLLLNDSYTLDASLPPLYPAEAKPTLYLSCAGSVDTGTRKQARSILARVLGEQEQGVECLDLIIQCLLEELVNLNPDNASASRSSDAGEASGNGNAENGIKTVLLWSHHLLATSKRKDIVSWSRELGLGGYSRPGYPGAILVEGSEMGVDEFVARIKALRWQALQVRGEEVTDHRRLDGDGVVEVEGLGDIVEALRRVDGKDGEGGMADWFLEGMRIAHS